MTSIEALEKVMYLIAEEIGSSLGQIENSLKALDIIKEHRVDTELFDIPNITLEKYNSLISYRKGMILSQEEYDLIKKELEK